MPFNAFISNLKTGYLYTFVSPKVHATIPHHFILLGHTDNYSSFFFNCCTSKFQKRLAYINLHGHPYSTLVPISPDSNNKLTNIDNCINCNSPIHHTKSELQSIFYNSTHIPPIPIKGRILDHQIQQLLIGTHDSDQVEEWIKDCIPKDIDLIKSHLIV